jgi:hypothetical protein
VRTRLSFAWVVAAVALTFALAAWGGPSRTKSGDDVDREVVAVLFAGQDGRLEPCGCSTPQAGGLVRAAALVDRLRRSRPDLAVLQLGSFEGARDTPAIARAKAEVFAAFRVATGCEQVEIAPPSGVEPAAAGAAWAYRRGGLRVWRDAVTSREDVRRLLAALDAAPDAGEVSIAVARGQAAVGSTGTWGPRLVLVRIGGALGPGEARGSDPVVALPDRGRAAVVVRRRGSEVSCEIVELDPSYEADGSASQDAVRRAWARYGDALEIDRALDQIPRIDVRHAVPFLGTEACGTCHSRELEAWRGTRHARALATLAARSRGRDPECVVCHTVGWRRTVDGTWLGASTGFAAAGAPTGLDAVGCEACHGAGGAHVAGRPALDGAWISRPTLAVCSACHDAESSPRFAERLAGADLSRAVHDVSSTAR